MRDINDYEKNYADEGFEYYQALYRKKKILEIIDKYKPKRLLEIGCGLDPLFPYVEGFTRFAVVEPSTMFIDIAKEKAKDDDRIVLYNELFEASDRIVNEDWDFIICSSLLHEVEEPKLLLKEIRKACNEKTIVHINVPNANSLHRLLAKAAGIISDTKDFSERNIRFQQHNVFDDNMLRECVCNEEFEVVDSGSYFIKPFTHDQMKRILEEQIVSESLLEGLYCLTDYLPENGSELYVNCRRKR